MRRPVLLRTVCAAAISVGCGEQPVAPPTTGSISLGIVAAEATPEPPAAAGQLDAARVRVKCSSASCGSTDVMANLARTGTNFTGTVNGLPPGAYAVVVEGLVANEVDYFGQTSGVQVTAGSNATAAITNWASFRPVLADLNSPTAETRFTAIWSRVANANGYSVEWGKTPSFTSRSPASVPDTFATITVNDTGIYNVRVRAVNDWEPSGGVGDAKSITVAATTTLQNGAPASGLTGAGGSQRYFKIQVPAGQGQLAVTISGGTGDANLYVRRDSLPTRSRRDCESVNNGNSDQCSLPNPPAGNWYALLDGVVAYSGVSLTAAYAGVPTQLAANSPPSQSAEVGTAVASPPSVLVKDAQNNPVPNVAVTFTVTAGGGTTVPASRARSRSGCGI